MEENETLEENLISESLQKTIDENIAKLREKNPKCRIYGIVVKGTEFDEKELYVGYFREPSFKTFSKYLYSSATVSRRLVCELSQLTASSKVTRSSSMTILCSSSVSWVSSPNLSRCATASS